MRTNRKRERKKKRGEKKKGVEKKDASPSIVPSEIQSRQLQRGQPHDGSEEALEHTQAQGRAGGEDERATSRGTTSLCSYQEAQDEARGGRHDATSGADGGLDAQEGHVHWRSCQCCWRYVLCSSYSTHTLSLSCPPPPPAASLPHSP